MSDYVVSRGAFCLDNPTNLGLTSSMTRLKEPVMISSGSGGVAWVERVVAVAVELRARSRARCAIGSWIASGLVVACDAH